MPQRFLCSAAITTAVVAVLVVLLPASRAQQSAPPANSLNRDKQLCLISGTVLRADTGEPLPKARVTLIAEDEDFAKSRMAWSDAAGHFEMAEILPASYRLDARRDGYLGEYYDAGEPGRSASIFTLKPGQQITDATFRLKRCAAISGKVTDEDGDPVQNASVEVVERITYKGKVNYGAVGSSVTNDLGEYRVFNLGPGTYKVLALAQSRSRTFVAGIEMDDSTLASVGGYVDTYFGGTTDPTRADTLEVKAGNDISDIDVSLIRERLYTIRGRVTNPLAGDQPGRIEIGLISLDPDSLTDNRLSTFTDEKTGFFEIRDVSEGSYTAVAAWRDGGNNYFGTEPVEVAGADVNSVNIVITRGATIRGKIILQTSAEKARDIEVNIYSRDRTQFARQESTEANADGSFQISGVMAGKYDLEISSSCDHCYTKSVRVGGEEIPDQSLAIGSAGSAYNVEVIYSLGLAIIEGTVSDSNGVLLAGTAVFLVPDPPLDQRTWLYDRVSTDQYGHFAMRRVTPGSYHVVALLNVDDSLDTRDPEFVKQFGSNAEAVTVGENDRKSVRVTALASLANASSPHDR